MNRNYQLWDDGLIIRTYCSCSTLHIPYSAILEGGHAKGKADPTGEGAQGGQAAVRLLSPEECGCASYSRYGTVRIDHAAVRTVNPRAAYCYPKDPVAFVKALKNKLKELEDDE